MTSLRPCVVLGFLWMTWSASVLVDPVGSTPIPADSSTADTNENHNVMARSSTPPVSYLGKSGGQDLLGSLSAPMLSDELGPLIFETRYLSDKRNPMVYSFGLGKRFESRKLPDAEWKRSATIPRFGFGLGKRSAWDADSGEDGPDNLTSENENHPSSGAVDDDDDDDEEDDKLMEKRTRPATASEYYTVYIPPSYLNYIAGMNSNWMDHAVQPHKFQAQPRPLTAYKKRDKFYVSNGPAVPKQVSFGKRLPVYDFGLGKRSV